jgi:hypothetical protein
MVDSVAGAGASIELQVAAISEVEHPVMQLLLREWNN